VEGRAGHGVQGQTPRFGGVKGRRDRPAHAGGIHRGADAVVAYLTESALLTGGTLRAEPQSVLADGQGHVAVPVRLSASRPDGRAMDGPQVVLVTVDDGRIRAIEQFVGDPAAVAAFWA
jgi:ketosteroid isomerase-like protein